MSNINNKKILLVDDDSNILDLMKSHLEDFSIESECFVSPQAVLDLKNYDAYMAIVTDIRMPGMNGVDLVLKLKEKGIDLPVFFITAYLDYPREVLNELKPRAIIFKPFDFEEAALLIKNQLNKS